MNRETAREWRHRDPAGRDEYVRDMKAGGEGITEALRQDLELEHTCYESPDKMCMRCDLGQQAAEMIDEEIGVEGVDF